MKVFISHKNADAFLARRVAERVQRNGLSTYLDDIDDALLKDGPELADHLLRRMSECQQLIAVVSNSTKESWWVPWEIGVGSEKGFRMASYAESNVQLPSYLAKWPALRSDSDIDKYCIFSKEFNTLNENRIRGAFSDSQRATIRNSTSKDFHTALMRNLKL